MAFQFEQVAVKSVPIVVGAGLSVGLVTWLQTHRLLAANGAESALPSFLSVAVVVEIGPMLAGSVWDLAHSYEWAFLPASAGCLIAMTLALIVRPPRVPANA